MKDYAELSMLIKIVDIKIKNTAKTVPHFLSNITANVRMRSVFKVVITVSLSIGWFLPVIGHFLNDCQFISR